MIRPHILTFPDRKNDFFIARLTQSIGVVHYVGSVASLALSDCFIEPHPELLFHLDHTTTLLTPFSLVVNTSVLIFNLLLFWLHIDHGRIKFGMTHHFL